MFDKLYALSVITFKEGIRNKAIYGITFFAVIALGIGTILSGMMMRNIGKFSVDIALSTTYFAGLLLVLFVCINLIAKDIDKRTLYMVLSKPISRSNYIVGKFLGLAMLIIVAVLFLTVLSVISIKISQMNYSVFFENFSWVNYFIAVFFEILSLLVLLSCVFLFTSFSSNSFIVLVLSVLTYIIGHSLTATKELILAAFQIGIEVPQITIYTLDLVSYIFPKFSLLNVSVLVGHGIDIGASQIFLSILYAVFYSVTVLSLAAFIFRRRQFP